jgi:deoxyribonuclease V
VRGTGVAATAVVTGTAGAAYEPGLLALREGALLEEALRALEEEADVALVDATGRDHPHHAGLATHLGAVLDLPTVGVTHRPLLAEGAWPADERGETSPLVLDSECVGHWVRTPPGNPSTLGSRGLADNPRDGHRGGARAHRQVAHARAASAGEADRTRGTSGCG